MLAKMKKPGDNMYCSFFGHHDYGLDSEICLLEEIEKLILCSDVDVFFVGNKGRFDRSVHGVLKKMKWKYPYIKIYLVLDTAVPPLYDEMNDEEREYMHWIKYFDFLVPDGIENVPKRYAMRYRNDWMIRACDVAVVYYLYPGTNTQKHVGKLMSTGKPIINIAELKSGKEPYK